MATERHDPTTGRVTTGHEWNGIEELDTPIPRVVLFFLAVVLAEHMMMKWQAAIEETPQTA